MLNNIMTATGLQKYIDINLDGTRTFKVDIAIYSPDPSQGTIYTAEVMEASVQSLPFRASTEIQSSHLSFRRPRIPSSASETEKKWSVGKPKFTDCESRHGH